MASVQLRNVTKAWGDVVVSNDINLDIHDGEHGKRLSYKETRDR